MALTPGFAMEFPAKKQTFDFSAKWIKKLLRHVREFSSELNNEKNKLCVYALTPNERRDRI